MPGSTPAVRPTLHFERRAWSAGCRVVAGVDEAGRGAWAGPLVAAAAILPCDGNERARLTRALNRTGLVVADSKVLTPNERCQVREVLDAAGVVASIAVVPVDEIDRIGLGVANRLALSRAAAGLTPTPDHLLVDALEPLDPPCPWEAVVHGDARCLAIAMASIIAKVHRDEIMDRLGADQPDYGFAQHKGYGTPAHREALLRHGVGRHHRRSFAPIAALSSHAG